ncbi:cyclic nucleotide-binding domain-containing protein [Thermithiobacillus tepidarius DSM 3134]|uniref:cyclic nucleotide-binding domain-containing protein n=1 Tax=Thermithiobacillus tepidarius TaxID=929 RepID=UPI0004115A95|nr:cyclic nucleotide-binding domain-containing protein [Thermithiobacillus tepidarius]
MFLKDFIRTLPDFKAFSENEINALATAMRVDDYPNGHVFIQQWEPGQTLYLLLEGEVTVSRYDPIKRERQDLKTLRPGELFGLLSLIEGIPAVASCTASGPVTAGALPHTAWHLLFNAAAPIARHFQYLVALQLAHDLQARNHALRALLK